MLSSKGAENSINPPKKKEFTYKQAKLILVPTLMFLQNRVQKRKYKILENIILYQNFCLQFKKKTA